MSFAAPGAAPDASGPAIVLASQSPRRAHLLSMLGLTFEVMPADIDERYQPGEDPAAHAERLAREKVRAIAEARPDALVVGCDTVVEIDGHVLGKPRDADDAIAMLMRLQGRAHTVATGVAVAHAGTVRSAAEQVGVRFRSFDQRIAECYVATGEAGDKAGAYGIQGFGATLVEHIDGDFFSVMGLPICRLIRLLEESGWRYEFPRLVQR